MKKYLVFIERKETFTGNSIPEHRIFLQNLRESKVLVYAGGFSDQSGGAYIVQAANLEQALETVQKDPMYQEGACIYKVKEWIA